MTNKELASEAITTIDRMTQSWDSILDNWIESKTITIEQIEILGEHVQKLRALSLKIEKEIK